MKGLFYFQEPNQNKIEGFECNVRKLNSFGELKDGFVVTTFIKDRILNLIPINSIALDKLKDIKISKKELPELEFDSYCDLINKAVSYCSSKERKVVMSRVVRQNMPDNFDIASYFVELCSKYHHSFNYCLHLDDGTTWVGATPEVLINNLQGVSQVYSLAGSRDADNPFEWTQKEKEEQLIVTEQIAKTLNGFGVQYKLTGPDTILAGNVEHLLSVFSFKTERSLELANALHPTPAVCGIPRDEAYQFIVENEPHSRDFYSGVIGRVYNGECSLFVNLRCAELTTSGFYCYVGGGITKSSDPKKEWEETNFKSQTLLSILKKK